MDTGSDFVLLRKTHRFIHMPHLLPQAVLALLRNWQAKRLAEAAAQADGLRDEHELEGALQLREAELAVREDDLRKKEEALSHKEAELGALAESLQGLQEEQQQRAKQIAVLEGHDDGGPDGGELLLSMVHSSNEVLCFLEPTYLA